MLGIPLASSTRQCNPYGEYRMKWTVRILAGYGLLHLIDALLEQL